MLVTFPLDAYYDCRNFHPQVPINHPHKQFFVLTTISASILINQHCHDCHELLYQSIARVSIFFSKFCLMKLYQDNFIGYFL
jgi:hypothetical protein